MEKNNYTNEMLEMRNRIISLRSILMGIIKDATGHLKDNIYQHREIIKTLAIIPGTIAAFTLLLFTSPNVQFKGLLVAAVFFLLFTTGYGFFMLKRRNEQDNKGFTGIREHYYTILDKCRDDEKKINKLIERRNYENYIEAQIVLKGLSDRIMEQQRKHMEQTKPFKDCTIDVMIWSFLPALVLIFLSLLLSFVIK